MLNFNKPLVRDKKPVSEAALIAEMGITAAVLNQIVETADAELVDWIDSPKLNNDNGRVCVCQLSRSTGAFGVNYIEEMRVEPFKLPAKKAPLQQSTTDSDGEEVIIECVVPKKISDHQVGGSSVAKKRRIRASGSAGRKSVVEAQLCGDVEKAMTNWRGEEEGDFGLNSSWDYSGDSSCVASESYARMIGMSPESVQIRVESAANAAKVEMHADFQAQAEKYMEAQVKIYEATLKQRVEQDVF